VRQHFQCLKITILREQIGCIIVAASVVQGFVVDFGTLLYYDDYNSIKPLHHGWLDLGSMGFCPL
jgi:hypothetical protein